MAAQHFLCMAYMCVDIGVGERDENPASISLATCADGHAVWGQSWA